MAGPWEKYAAPSQAQGPWQKYGAPAPTQPQPASDAGVWERNTLLPREVNSATGESRLAMPGIIQGPMDAAIDLATLPGDVMTGKVDPMSSEGIARAAGGAATVMMPGVSGMAGKTLAPLAKSVGDQLVEAAASSTARSLPTLAKAIPQPLSVAGARVAAKSAFKAAEDTGAIVSKPAMEALSTSMRKFADDEGLILPSGEMVDVFPKVRGAYKALDEFTAAPMSIKSAMVLQKHLRRVAKSTDPEEARLGAIMMDRFEDFMTNAKPEAFSAGDGKKAVEAWMKGKSEWARFKRGEMVLDAITSAQSKAHKFSGSGFENSLRREFDKIADNPRRMRYFDADEKAFIEAVRQGTPIANALRGLGKAAPTGIVSTVLSALAGYGIGGPFGAAAMLGVGAGARHLATAETKKSADEALQFVLGARPETKAPVSAIPKAVPKWAAPVGNAYGRATDATIFDDAGQDINRTDLRRRIGTTISM